LDNPPESKDVPFAQKVAEKIDVLLEALKSVREKSTFDAILHSGKQCAGIGCTAAEVRYIKAICSGLSPMASVRISHKQQLFALLKLDIAS
jgi:hypothetical protein